MRLDDYDQQDGKRVWLSRTEIGDVIDEAQDARQRIAFTLAGKAGLRRSEIVSVTRNDFVHGPDGYVRVWDDYTKTDQYREAPIPSSFEHFVLGVTEGDAADQSVVDVVGSTVYRWVQRAAERLHAATRDEGWTYLDVHDLRRSWGGIMLWILGLQPVAVKEFGGWDDWATFEEHYMGEMPPEARDRERGKIQWDRDVEGDTEAPFSPASPGATEAYRR